MESGHQWNQRLDTCRKLHLHRYLPRRFQLHDEHGHFANDLYRSVTADRYSGECIGHFALTGVECPFLRFTSFRGIGRPAELSDFSRVLSLLFAVRVCSRVSYSQTGLGDGLRRQVAPLKRQTVGGTFKVRVPSLAVRVREALDLGAAR